LLIDHLAILAGTSVHKDQADGLKALLLDLLKTPSGPNKIAEFKAFVDAGMRIEMYF